MHKHIKDDPREQTKVDLRYVHICDTNFACNMFVFFLFLLFVVFIVEVTFYKIYD